VRAEPNTGEAAVTTGEQHVHVAIGFSLEAEVESREIEGVAVEDLLVAEPRPEIQAVPGECLLPGREGNGAHDAATKRRLRGGPLGVD
jgi:hypothetical protein